MANFVFFTIDQRKTFDPAAYFRFKSEKEVEAQDPAEESQQARKLLEIRLDDIEKVLMTLSIKERLYLRDSDVDAVCGNNVSMLLRSMQLHVKCCAFAALRPNLTPPPSLISLIAMLLARCP
jgi:hypothetical protein